MPEKSVILIGYSGHAFVAYDIFEKMGWSVAGYCDREEKSFNPFQIPYLGSERDEAVFKKFAALPYFIAIGDNATRRQIFQFLKAQNLPSPATAIHPGAQIGRGAKIGSGVMLAANAVINPLAEIGTGVICNTGCIIEHECRVDDFAHIAPGAVLAGNVAVGKNAFIGAGAIIKQGIKIGENAVVGAGAVVIRDVPDGATVVGNPARQMRSDE
ncbi:MAG TPA: acetyltransferase [Saprospiraceae bacterium]|nr:acetyltransferase [Saprospiraceae bacterium]